MMLRVYSQRMGLKGVLAALATCVALAAAGCGIDPQMTAAQQERDAALKMAWVDKLIDVAERHNLAYRVEVNASGRPSIGETVDLYLDTGLSAKVFMFGNGAGARQPVGSMTP